MRLRLSNQSTGGGWFTPLDTKLSNGEGKSPELLGNKLKEKLGGVQMALNERQIKVVEHIQATGFLTNRSFKELFPMI